MKTKLTNQKKYEKVIELFKSHGATSDDLVNWLGYALESHQELYNQDIADRDYSELLSKINKLSYQ